MFWLRMNKGLWFSSPQRLALTLFNTFAICVGIALVSSNNCLLYYSRRLPIFCVALVFTPLESPFMAIQAVQAFSCANNA